MAFIPEDKLLEIKDAASIEEVVGQYVKLELISRSQAPAWERTWNQSSALSARNEDTL